MSYLQKFLRDIKKSRYFQFWFLMWVIFGVIIIVSLVNLSTYTNLNETQPNYKTWRIWEEPTSLIDWPDFTLSIIPNVNSTVSCSIGNTVLSVQDDIDPNGQNYKIIYASSFLASGINNTIICLLNTGKGNTLKWNIRTPTSSSIFISQSIYVSTVTFLAQISLKKTTYEDSSGQITGIDWHPIVTYIPNTTLEAGVYFTITDFTISHYREYDWLIGWQSFGEFGGTLFMTYILHRFIMTILSPCIEMDSVLFGAQESEYGAQESEYKRIVS